MGQYWELYNLDKRAAISFSGSVKLGSWFFDDQPTRILTKLRHNTESNWAGDRIICLGDYAHSTPEGVFAEEISAFVKEGKSLKMLKEELPQHTKIKAVIEMTEFRGEGVPEQENFDYSNYVLHNLSKKMFVRGNNPPVAIPGWITNSFGQTLFAYIFWSDDNSTNMRDRAITRGEWAGDRFDIVEFNEVKDELNREGWEDCTEELKQRAEGIYRVEGFI